MEAFARIGVLVKARAVEAAEAEVVGGEMAWYPVDDDAEAGGVCRVDECARVVGRAEAARRRKPAGGLVAPRSVEGVLRDRQQFEVREPKVARIRHEFFG